MESKKIKIINEKEFKKLVEKIADEIIKENDGVLSKYFKNSFYAVVDELSKRLIKIIYNKKEGKNND